MAFGAIQLGKESLEREALRADKKDCRRFGPCGVGKQALYLNSFYLDRRYYVPVSSVQRVFKRIAMSRGGFTGRGMFASLSYLVVVYDGGKEKQCIFKHEEQVDQMLEYIGSRWPRIRLMSADAEARLKKKEEERKSRRLAKLPEGASREVERIEKARAYLERRPALCSELSAAAKKKRTYEKSNPAYKWVAACIVLMGACSAGYGVYALMHHMGLAMYFLLFGLAAIFLFSGSMVLPTSRNNRKSIDARFQKAAEAMERYLKDAPDAPAFPVPARYAHPVTLAWMAEDIRCGLAADAASALEKVKEELRHLNSEVEVDQEDFESIMTIKPMFLVNEYR